MIPKLSIITINLNNAEGLCKTIESVVSQTFTDYEYIIIDGASTDGSVDVIKQYADGIIIEQPSCRITYWVSEADNGIYNAMNKGIRVANGDYCLFLNSGDCLANNETLSYVLKNSFDSDIISGYVCGNKYGEFFNIYPPKEFTFRYLYSQNIPHQAEFIKRKLFDEIGFYNEQYQILSDYEFNIKAMLHNVSYLYINSLVTVVDLSGVSSDDCNQLKRVEEEKSILQSNFPNSIMNDYMFFLDKKKLAHPSINWLLENNFFFKSLKFLYRCFRFV